MTLIYVTALLVVIGGHFFFAYGQWFRWPSISKKLLDLTDEEARKTASLGRSFSSYNTSIGVGLSATFLLRDASRDWAQGLVLALIVATAAVGAAGTNGNTILAMRLLPALAALVLLLVCRLT